MLVTKKMLLALTLVGALVGIGIGSLVTHSAQSTNASTASSDVSTAQAATSNEKTPEQIAATNSSRFSTTEEQTAYRQGFEEGYSACTSSGVESSRYSSRSAAYTRGTAPVYRTSRVSSSRRVYYDYGTTRSGRTFWQKHRDKLTLAMGTGLGAAIGGIAGGGKGAAIGSLAGLGGSALYTYKLRHRTHRY